MIWALRTEVSNRLRLNDNGYRKGAADADVLEQKASAIGRTIERRVLLGFAEFSGFESTQRLVLMSPPTDAAARPTTSANLVRHEDAESHTDRLSTIQRVEAVLQRRSVEINARLADALGRCIDEAENPLLPAVLCNILRHSTTEYCNTPRVRRHLQEAICQQIIPLLSDLYDDLDAILDEHSELAS